MPAASPVHADPVTAAVAAAANAAASIFPSRPMSTTPDRSAKRPPRAARTSGAAPRTVAAARSARSRKASATGGSLVDRPVPCPVGGRDEEEVARLAQDQPMPDPARDEAGLPAPEPETPLAGRLVEHDVEGTGNEIEHLVAARVDLPLVGMEVCRHGAALHPDHAVAVARHEPPEHV